MYLYPLITDCDLADDASSSTDSGKKSFILRPSALDKHTATMSPAQAGNAQECTGFIREIHCSLKCVIDPTNVYVYFYD